MSKRREKKDAKRLEILAVAAAAFRNRGFHGSSMDGIAQSLGRTKGNLYHYFPDKEAILFSCHEYFLDRQLNSLARIEKGDYSPDVKFLRVVSSFVQAIIDDVQGGALGLEVKELTGAQLRKIVAKRDKFERGLRRLLKQGMEQGLFRETDPKLLAFAILGALNWISRWYRRDGPVQLHEVGETFGEFFPEGLLRKEQADPSVVPLPPKALSLAPANLSTGGRQ